MIAKEKQAIRQVVGYQELERLFAFYGEFEIVPFDEVAARRFDDLRSYRLRLGTMDLINRGDRLEPRRHAPLRQPQRL